MKKVIWKYPLLSTPHQTLHLPKGAEILSLDMQDNIPCMWVLITQQTDLEERHFRTIGTGNLLDDHFTGPYRFIGTYQPQSNLVFHVFETKD